MMDFTPFCEGLLVLKEKLKCPVCLDIIQENAQLECSHRLCSNCFDNIKTNNQQVCPLCKSVITRRFVAYKDAFADKVAKFLSDVCSKIEEKNGCTIEQLVHNNKEQDVQKTKKQNVPSTSKENNLETFLKITREKVKADNNKRNLRGRKDNTLKSSKQHSTEVVTKDVIADNKSKADKGKSKQSSVQLQNVCQMSVSKEDAFDRLLKRSQDFLVNKKGTRQKYTRKKKDNDEEYQILDFHDNSNRYDVLSWLSDTRNKFDRLTQTQTFIEQRSDEPHDIPIIDLTSVSQLNRKRELKVPTYPKMKTRSKSLEGEAKHNREIFFLSDGSLPGIENYTIEDNTEDYVIKKAEENVIMHIIEDEYLNKMEKDLIKKSAPQNDQQTTQNSTAGWDRIEKITKTLKKKEKVPKKLNVSVQQTPPTRGKRILNKLLNEQSLNEQTSPTKENKKDLGHKEQTNSRKGDLNTSGGNTDVSDEVVRKTTRRSTRPNTRKSGGIRSLDPDKTSSVVPEVANHKEKQRSTMPNTFKSGGIGNFDPDETSVAAEIANDAEKELHVLEIKAVIHNNADHIEDVVANPVNLSPKQKLANRLYNMEDFEQYVQNNLEEIPKSLNDTSQNSDKENMQNAANESTKLVIISNVLVKNLQTVDPYTLPTQKINTSDHTEQCMDIDHELNIDKDARNESVEMNESFDEFNNFDEGMNKLLSNLEKYSENLKKNKHITKIQVENVRISLEKLNDIHKKLENMSKLSFAPKCTDQNIQTDKNVVECAVQTVDEYSTTINNLCKNCNKKVMSRMNSSSSSPRTRASSRRNSGKSNASKMMPNDEFAASLDLLNFETQDIEKEFIQKLKDVANKNTGPNKNKSIDMDVTEAENQMDIKSNKPDEIADESKGNISTNNKLVEKEDENVLVCTMKSEDPELKGHLSLKRNLSDSDSDVVAVPKRHCNRFIRDDLSVEFGTSENPSNYKKTSFSTGLSPETNEEDDDEYLNKILKKYETGVEECNRSPAVKKGNVDMELEDNFEDMLARLNKTVEESSKPEKPESHRSNPVLEDNRVILNDHNSSKLDTSVQYKESESSDIIPETETMEPLPKRVKRKLNEVFNKGTPVYQSKETASASKTSKETFCHELEDSLDGVDFANIDMEEAVNNSENFKAAEDDLFSDDDVVESTPQKEVDVTERKSQLLDITTNRSLFPVLDEVDKEIIDNFDVNFATLSPPPGFEDEKDPTEAEDITVINKEPSQKPLDETRLEATPVISRFSQRSNKIITPTSQRASGFASLDVSVQKLTHSTPVTQNNLSRNTLGLSPIVQEKSLFEKAYSSNTLTSSAIRDTPRKNSMLTSLPKQKSILNYVKQSQESIKASGSKQKPCLACTRLSKIQIQGISLLTNKKLATYSTKFSDSVTHMIVTLDETKRIRDYTMKFVSAVASGIWVLGYEWVEECLKTNSIVPEEPYEAFDESGGIGPKTARISRLENPLFKELKFFCVSPLYSTSVEDIEDVITKLGGTTVKNLESLKDNDGRIGLIITEGRSTQDFEIYEKWLEKYKIVTVDIEWLSRSVGTYKVLSVRPYIWCSDELIDDIGYPQYLIEHSNSSLSLQE